MSLARSPLIWRSNRDFASFDRCGSGNGNQETRKPPSVCRSYHVVELSGFGSVARGEAGDASDVGLLASTTN